MKSGIVKIRLSIALVIMLSAVGAVLGNHEVRAESGPMCTCSHPVTGRFGTLIRIGPYWDCVETDCWLPLE